MNEDLIPYEEEKTTISIGGFKASKLAIMLVVGVSAIMLIYFGLKR